MGQHFHCEAVLTNEGTDQEESCAGEESIVTTAPLTFGLLRVGRRCGCPVSCSLPKYTSGCPAPFVGTAIPLMTGTAGQKRVSKDHFSYSPFPLAPLPEQHRIVAKVDELMALCDELESELEAKSTYFLRLVGATLKTALLTTRKEIPDPARRVLVGGRIALGGE